MLSRKGQAAFEYLVTYGWAFLGAIIAIGALAYFGFLSPSNLMPNRCNFGNQLECFEYRIFDDGEVNIIFKNNFGKPIMISDIQLVDGGATYNSGDVYISAGGKNETNITMPSSMRRPENTKQEVTMMVNFSRTDLLPASNHYVTGSLFTTVQGK